MQKVFAEKSPWKEKFYVNELYILEDEEQLDLKSLEPITQVQAVCIDEEGNLVIYKHINGWYGLPGGKVEPGEDYVEALKREVDEETASELIKCGLIGFNKSWEESKPEEISYNLRYWAIVKPLDKELQDPAGKAIERLIVPKQEALRLLNWGEKGEILIENAINKAANEN